MASSDNNEQLTYELQATFDKFAASFDQATKTASDSFAQMEARGKDASDRMTASIKSAVSSISGAFTSLQAPAKSTGDVIGAVIGGSLIAAATGFAGIMDKLINTLADAGDRADALRLPINILQALSVAADEARVPTETLNSALDHFTAVSKQAADDAKDFYKALGNIGPGFAKAFESAPTQADRLRVLMDAFKSTTDEVKRAQLAQTAFGTDSERLISIMSGGRGAIADYIDEMRRLGLEVDESAVKKSQQAKSALSLLARVMTDELSSALAELIPSFKEFLPMLEKVAGYVRDTVSGFASPENRPLATLKNDAQAAEEHIADLQKQLADLSNYKPTTGIIGAVSHGLGVDTYTSHDANGQLDGVAVDIAKAKKNIQDEIASTQSALAQYKKLIADKQKVEDSNKGHDGAEAPAFKPRPKLTPDDKDTSAFERQTNALNRHIAALQADAAAVGLTDAAHQRLRAELELLQAAQRDDKNITEQQIDAYARLRTSMGSQQALAAAGIQLNAQQAAAFSQTSSRMEEAAQSLDQARQKFQGANDALRFAGDQLIDVFDKAQGRAQSFQQIMQGVLQQVERQLLQAALTGDGAFGKLFGTASTTGGVGGLLGGILKLFGGARAGGGDVSSDKAYVVGEKGPEIFRPNAAGSIIPNHKIALGDGSRNSTVNAHTFTNNVTVNANGGTKEANEDLARQVARQVNDGMRQMVMSELRTQMRPGGVIASAKPY